MRHTSDRVDPARDVSVWVEECWSAMVTTKAPRWVKRVRPPRLAPSVSVARALVVASALACPGTPGHGQVPPVSCGVFAADTRWLAESYRETDTYGVGSEEEWITSYGGLAARGDSVFFYDHVWPRIVHLSGELEERHAFGRRGKGSWRVPRLLAYQMVGRHLGRICSFRRASSGSLRPLEPRFLRYRWRVPVVCPAAVPRPFDRRAVRQSSGRERADLWSRLAGSPKPAPSAVESATPGPEPPRPPVGASHSRTRQRRWPGSAGRQEERTVLLGAAPQLRRGFGWRKPPSLGGRPVDLEDGFNRPS